MCWGMNFVAFYSVCVEVDEVFRLDYALVVIHFQLQFPVRCGA